MCSTLGRLQIQKDRKWEDNNSGLSKTGVVQFTAVQSLKPNITRKGILVGSKGLGNTFFFFFLNLNFTRYRVKKNIHSASQNKLFAFTVWLIIKYEPTLVFGFFFLPG